MRRRAGQWHAAPNGCCCVVISYMLPQAVLAYFDKLSEGRLPVHYPRHVMVKLTPFDVHTPALNDTNVVVERTFVKVAFSKKPYNLIGASVSRSLSTHIDTVCVHLTWPTPQHTRLCRCGRGTL